MVSYVVNQDAKDKLKRFNLDKKINTWKKDNKYSPGYLFKDDVIFQIKDLKKNGFYDHFPSATFDDFKTKAQSFVNDESKFFWKITKNGKTNSYKSELFDLMILSGAYASEILDKNVLWDFNKFGFKSPVELAGVVGASMHLAEDKFFNMRKGYVWTKKDSNGEIVTTEITGSEHCDLRIIKRNLTERPTIDPFGNPVEYRPLVGEDSDFLSAYHSVEPTLLAIIFKYVDVLGLTPEFKKDKGKSLIEWGQSIDRLGNATTESLMGDRLNYHSVFINYSHDFLKKLNQDDKKVKLQRGSAFISKEFRGLYTPVIDTNDDLLFYDFSEKDLSVNRDEVAIRFSPSDVDDLVKGLVFQCAQGLGRTPVSNILGLINYFYSGKLEEDIKRFSYKK